MLKHSGVFAHYAISQFGFPEKTKSARNSALQRYTHIRLCKVCPAVEWHFYKGFLPIPFSPLPVDKIPAIRRLYQGFWSLPRPFRREAWSLDGQILMPALDTQWKPQANHERVLHSARDRAVYYYRQLGSPRPRSVLTCKKHEIISMFVYLWSLEHLNIYWRKQFNIFTVTKKKIKKLNI